MQFATKLISSIALAATLASAVVVSRQDAGNYTTVFSDQFAAVEDRDFLTFKLLDTVDGSSPLLFRIYSCAHMLEQNALHSVTALITAFSQTVSTVLSHWPHFD